MASLNVHTQTTNIKKVSIIYEHSNDCGRVDKKSLTAADTILLDEFIDEIYQAIEGGQDRFIKICKSRKLKSILSVDNYVKYLHMTFTNYNMKASFNTLIDKLLDEYELSDVLMSIAKHSNVDLLRHFFRSCDICKNVSSAILKYACETGKLKMAEYVYSVSYQELTRTYEQQKKMFDEIVLTPNENDMSIDTFIIAVVRNKYDLVKKILENSDVLPNVKNNFAIKYACEYGYVEIVYILLKYACVDETDDNFYPFRMAEQRNYKDIISLLMSR
uniref:Uncharacterized protein n=1 Tax=viral metagenome TaxID=1070528 RepID=A0A6C0C7Q6_9ZZZZ